MKYDLTNQKFGLLTALYRYAKQDEQCGAADVIADRNMMPHLTTCGKVSRGTVVAKDEKT